MRTPDFEEKQQPYFRYPRPDPYHGFFEKRENQSEVESTPPVEEEPPDPEPD